MKRGLSIVGERRSSRHPPTTTALVLVVIQQAFRTCKTAAGAFWQAARPLCSSCEPSSAYTTAAPLCTNLTASVRTRVLRRGCKVCGFVRPCSLLLPLEAGCSRKKARPLVVNILGSTTPFLEKERRASGCRQDMCAYLLPAWRSRYADIRGYPLA